MPRGLYALLLLALVSLVGAEGVADKFRVSLRVYFRAFCPACQWYVGDPLLELVRNEQFRNILDFKLFPAAGMTEKNGELKCEGGKLECSGHRVQACVIDKDRDDVVKYLGNIACIEGDESGQVGDWKSKMNNCLTPEERALVMECYEKKSTDLLLEMIRKERSGSVSWMPYTLVEEKVLGSATRGVSLKELETNVCSAYRGPQQFYPDVCVELVGEQKEIASEEPAAVAKEKAAAVAEEAALAAKEDEGELELDIKEEEEDAAPSGKVRFEIYWRAFCPGCMAFITRPLLQLLSDPEVADAVDFRPVPAAGTKIDSAGNFVCVKGMVECTGHKWISCAIDQFPKVTELIQYLACMESKDNKGTTWDVVMGKCFTGEAHKKISQCFETKSSALLKKHIEQRSKVNAPWVPYVIINGTPVGDAHHGLSYKQVLDPVCNAYSGPQEKRPKACERKNLRDETATTDNQPMIKPCPQKKEEPAGKGAVYEDAPGIGARVMDAAEQQGGAAAAAAAADEDSSWGIQSLLLPGICFVVVIVLALRFSGDHKKYA